MPIIGIRFDDQEVKLEDCVSFAEANSNRYAPEIVAGMVHFAMDERTGISATALLDCPRCCFLERMNDYYVNYENYYWAFRGQLGHALCEKFARPGAIVEKRFYRTIMGITISGKPDTIYPDKKAIRDFKTCKAIPTKGFPYKNHPPQLNVYRWILAKPDNEEPIEIDNLIITYMDMRSDITLPAKIDNNIESFILSRASILKHAFDTGQIPDVPDEYPNFWKCKDYCSMTKQCSQVWKLGRRV